MNKLEGVHCGVSFIEQHTYICDLIHVEVPLLCLYRDQRSSWLYLWVDTDGDLRNRWLLVQVGREGLVDYLAKKKSLLQLFEKLDTVYCLDSSLPMSVTEEKHGSHRALRIVSVEVVKDSGYLPSKDSFFDETLTADISVGQEIAPNKFEVPIDGEWFFSDLDKFSRAYGRLYAFAYCTRPRFVANLGARLSRYLNSPWQGGYSRVNMFDALQKLIPSVHDTRVAKLEYASPGAVTIEALASVGAVVRTSVLAAVSNRLEIKNAVGVLDGTLAGARLKKQNLSRMSDRELQITSEALETLRANTATIASLLSLDQEIETIRQHSPNSVVTAKAVLALVTQVNRIAEYQRTGMLTL